VSDELRRESLRRHLLIIDQGVAPVAERYAEHMHCAPGCSDCCHQTFRVSALEGEFLREGLSRCDAELRAPCPVLGDDGRCLMYEHRPRICRKYGIPLWHPDKPHEVRCCSLNFRDAEDIDSELILEPQAAWAEDWIRVREALGITDTEDRTIAEHLLQAGPRVV